MIFFFLIPFSLVAKERIGVMDFIESEGLPRDTGKTAATHAIIALLDSQKYTVIEKSTVEFILKEQASEEILPSIQV
jgi:curli biogenesis system outer membrane secretion channel CsgG